MAKKKADVTEPEPQAEPTAEKKTSKADAVRAALAKGIDAPEDGVAFILKEFGIELSKQMFSSYKTQEKARKLKAAGQEGHGRANEPAPRITPSSRDGHAVHTGNAADLARQVKALVEAHGAAAVHGMVDVFEE